MTTTEAAIAVVLAVTIMGCVLGLKERMVIFRNYDDLGLVFLVVAPLCIGFITQIPWILIPAIVIGAGLCVWLTWRTWQDNGSVWKVLIALPTKLVLSVLFIAFVWELLSPSGKTQMARAKQRGTAAAILAVITPVIYRLVRDKVGVWVPRDVLKNTRRGLTHGS